MSWLDKFLRKSEERENRLAESADFWDKEAKELKEKAERLEKPETQASIDRREMKVYNLTREELEERRERLKVWEKEDRKEEIRAKREARKEEIRAEKEARREERRAEKEA